MDRAVHVIDALQRIGRPVAPHVAGAMAELGEMSAGDAAEMSDALTPGQLTGMEALPLVLPAPASVRARYAPMLEAVGAAGRHLLLTAALSTTDRIEVVLGASGIDASVMLAPGMSRLLEWDDGRMRFTSAGARAAVLAAAPNAAEVHAALARALRQRGERSRAAWHACHSSSADESTQRELARFGEQLLAAGSVHGALECGRLLTRRGAGALRARGHHLFARAALALGCFADARSGFVRVLQDPSAAPLHAEATAGRAAAEDFLHGVRADPPVLAQIGAQVVGLRAASVTASDHVIISGIEEIVAAWTIDRDEVDAIHTRLMLAAMGSRPAWPWRVEPGPLSPLVDAYLRGQHTGFLLHTGDFAGAAAALRESLRRLPMTHLAGGITASAVRLLRDHAPDLSSGFAEVLGEVRPATVLDFSIQDDLPGPRTSAVARKELLIPTTPSLRSALTPRQWDVAVLVAEGRTNRAIGDALGISDRTVEVHLGRVYNSLGVRSRAELVALLLSRRARGVS